MSRDEREGRRVTLVDVAARAGVSTALVSIVMRGAPGASPANRERVMAAVAELGYRPDARARLLRTSRSRLIGVVFDVEHAFHADVVSGLYAAAEAVGYEIALSAITPGRDEDKATDTLLTDRCEALVLVGPQAPVLRLTQLAARLPVVVVARAVRTPAVDVVRNAEAVGVDQAVDHLVALGHRHIAHIDGGRAPGAAERRAAWRAALRRHGMADGASVPGGVTEDAGAEAAGRLLRPPGTTAIVAFNDRVAAGVLDTARRAGVDVPRDLSVVGYDDSPLARLAVLDLTSVAQDASRLAELAVQRVAERVAGAAVRRREVVVQPRLVVRGSTGPAPQNPRTGGSSR